MRCAICERDLPPEALESHHLVPKERGGSKGATVRVCVACHDFLHKKLTNRQLAAGFSTVDELRGHPEVNKFAAWIRKTKKVKVKIR